MDDDLDSFDINHFHRRPTDQEILKNVKTFTVSVVSRLADGESVTITRNGDSSPPQGMFTVTFPEGLHARPARIKGGEPW